MNPDKMPLVTAVIPLHNHEKYVVESIRSILNQTYRNIELIVLNDGSKDHSDEMVLTLVEECKRRFVRFEYINQKNIGLSGSLNQALAWARGVYFTGTASDDVDSPEKIELLVDALEAKGPTYAAAFGNALFIDDSGQPIRLDKDGRVSDDSKGNTYDNFLDFYTHARNLDYRGEAFGTYASLIAGNYLPAISIVARTSVVAEVGGWTQGNMLEDWEMWLKLSKKSKFLYVDKPVSLYRWHESNTMKTSRGKLRCEALVLLAGEKRFCLEHGLAETWREEYSGTLSLIMKDKNVPFSMKVSVIDFREVWSFFSWSIRRIARRVVGRIMARVSHRKWNE